MNLQIRVSNAKDAHDALLRRRTQIAIPVNGDDHRLGINRIAVFGVAARLRNEHPTFALGDFRKSFSGDVLHTATCMSDECCTTGESSK